MGKLNIAHHKSYHPYRRDNIERVRRDEEEAARKDAEQEGRIALADAEARLALLRDRAGIAGGGGKGKQRAVEGDVKGKHINLFEDLEQQAMVTAIRATKKTAPSEADKGIALAPSTKDLNPWYTGTTRDRGQDDSDERRQRDLRSKTTNDPLTSITRQLARPPTGSSVRPTRRLPDNSKPLDPTSARLHRESSERERALALRRRKQQQQGSATPSTVESGYGDVYNRSAVEEAHKRRRNTGMY